MEKPEETNTTASKKEVVGISRLSRKPCLLAEYADNKWSLNDYNISLVVEKKKNQDAHTFEIKGDPQVSSSSLSSMIY